KPFPCPGRCIFCPNDPNMPKSYISSEPGAQRALTNHFDPYAQVYNRLIALKNVGHNIEKVELLVLGGSWSAYPQDYQLWFVTQCYKALNDISPESTEYIPPKEDYESEASFFNLEKEHLINETAYCRNVGLVFETRPDLITKEEVIHLRKLGATKIQIGIQSLDDKILKANNIGRKVKDVRKAIKLLRLGGFKIHGHWMPNLYKATVNSDIADYKKLWRRDFSPDELKIYPTSIVPNTYLYNLYKKNMYSPYTEEELLEVLVSVIPTTPRYCRLSRIIRDIPSEEIVAGNKKTNLRQIAEKEIEERGFKLQEIRSREIQDSNVKMKDLEMEIINYKSSIGKEVFISFKTKKTDKICGFLRLCLPNPIYKRFNYIKELRDSSIIREVHVYGKVMSLTEDSTGQSQHLGLGKKLIEKAEEISKKNGFKNISVISAVGTREYYKARGYTKGVLYMKKEIVTTS
ncbi:MAG TPA: tRNA uridine(34) 5-carboxymethylaminomethyl modification radical SAM/GNAT enzyme Elp3, partial [Candidatus Dojkabacteria bacterium]|nr:tRNA uridine(34) 5-carboxymethylaminomethyl modification radical SAM/GNAT enzyme Elp3 [Candidatus Dojkabacteria bacterium]